ncbi:STAS domain-containing protein [Pontibacter toksunensis]|uniref:Anti-sigma factor antagonist n=1 Tax=Pontibacter toksunensis TaxID=1332631 RepID=A0ABW6BQ81_9BACT
MDSSLHHFNTSFLPVENGIILSMKGELDASSSLMTINILENIVASGVGHLILDCTEMKNISSAGIGVILSVYHLSLEKHTRLTLFGLQPQIQSLFEALGINRLMHITHTREEALTPAAVVAKLA